MILCTQHPAKETEHYCAPKVPLELLLPSDCSGFHTHPLSFLKLSSNTCGIHQVTALQNLWASTHRVVQGTCTSMWPQGEARAFCLRS